MITSNISKSPRFFYYIYKNFTKIVFIIFYKACKANKIIYKKITPTENLVKSEIFIYNEIYKSPKLLYKKKKIQTLDTKKTIC